MRVQNTVRGFTLLEVLLAITLLALLIAGAYGGIRAASTAMHTGEVAIDRIDRMRTAQEFLRHQFSRLLPLVWASNQSNGKNYIFEADDRRMRFVAPMPGYLSRGGPYVQTLELVPGKDGLQLRFSDTMLNGFDVDKPKDSDVEPVVLLDGIRSGRFSYRGIDEQGDLAPWSSSWPDPGVTPLVVRVELTMRDAQASWPVLDVPMMLNAGAVRPRRPIGPTVIRANGGNP